MSPDELRQVASMMAKAVEISQAPLLARIAALEQRPLNKVFTAIPGPQGEKGIDGLVGPIGPPGPAGDRGMDGEVGQHGPMGERGERGPDGVDGLIGETGPMGPKGERGFQGLPGAIGPPGFDGKQGTAGIDGKDGIGIADIVVKSDGHLFVMLTDGKSFDAGNVRGIAGEHGRDGLPGVQGPAGKDGLNGIGKDGIDGMNGKDGVGFTEFDFDFETKELIFRGNGLEQRRFLPFACHRGLWEANRVYLKADMVAFEGAHWIALDKTMRRPNMPDSGWQLCSMRGPQGKRGPEGPQGPPGPISRFD